MHLPYGRLGARQNLSKDPIELWEAGPTGRWEPIPAGSLVGLPGFSRHVSSPAADCNTHRGQHVGDRGGS